MISETIFHRNPEIFNYNLMSFRLVKFRGFNMKIGLLAENIKFK
jgi:hypothetical protein